MNKLLTTMLCVLLSLLITLGSANDKNSSKPCDNKVFEQMSSHGCCGQNACFCAPGIPGIPGSPGTAGSAGAVGSPGNHGHEGPMGPRGNKGDEGPRGIKGVQGSKGRQGPAGPSGPPGRKGDAGARGRQGQPGPKGPQGLPGASGPRGSKGDAGARGSQGPPGLQGPPGTSGRNWKQCAFKNLNDNRDTGLIKDCVFKKMSAKTALRVYWAGNLRIYNCEYCCSRWYFTFNGAECSTPAAIDGVVYMRHGTGGKYTKNLHRPRHIEGVCEKLHKGTVRVGFWVGRCANYKSVADAYTGWNSVSRIYIEEIPPPQA